jgi:hypothetical protein
MFARGQQDDDRTRATGVKDWGEGNFDEENARLEYGNNESNRKSAHIMK